MSEASAFSRKSFDMKLGLLAKSRSRNVVIDSSAPLPEDSNVAKQSLWTNLPPELLREILVKIEESEGDWPTRRNVVVCAGVCRSWREIMRDVVKVPEISGKFTFPISVKQPAPREPILQCFIRRNRSTHTYNLYLNITQALADDGKFLLAARKFRRTTCTDYNISLHTEDMSKGSIMYIGKLRSNFMGTKFVIYDGMPPQTGTGTGITKSRSTKTVGLNQVSPRVPAGNYPVAHISYELNALGSRGPRRMNCVIDTIPAACIEPGGSAPTQTDLPLSGSDPFLSIPFFRSKSTRHETLPENNQRLDASLVLKNKSPRWHEQLQCWCLNFHGRVTVASVKNFQLVACTENGEGEKVILQFGKVGKDVFTMDYGFPLSAFQAFAICLSSFDTRIACE